MYTITAYALDNAGGKVLRIEAHESHPIAAEVKARRFAEATHMGIKLIEIHKADVLLVRLYSNEIPNTLYDPADIDKVRQVRELVYKTTFLENPVYDELRQRSKTQPISLAAVEWKNNLYWDWEHYFVSRELIDFYASLYAQGGLDRYFTVFSLEPAAVKISFLNPSVRTF